MLLLTFQWIVIRRVRSSTPIEIDACVSYAIGESGDEHPRPLIWVSGRGGWYEIEPAPEYCQIYNKMCEATTMYYIMIDIYNSGGRRKTAKKSKKADWMEELAPILHQVNPLFYLIYVVFSRLER